MRKLIKLGVNEGILAYGIPAVSLLVWTASTMDPVNLPKMVLLVAMSFSLVPFVIARVIKMQITRIPFFVLLNLLFMFWVLIATLRSDTNVLQSFYGVSGRYTGALTYTAFSLLAVATFFLSNTLFHTRLLAGFIFAGVVNIVYCAYVIISKSDPIPWTNIYGSILGTFGNPNFISSFLGIFNIIVLAKIIDTGVQKRVRGMASALLIVSVLEIINSESRQGLIVSAIGCGGVLIYKLYKSQTSLFLKLFGFATYILLGLFALLGMLQIGPLTKLVYKASVSIRGAYWRAGWETMWQNPTLGIGPDSFGDWYTRVRDSRAMEVPGPDVFTNSPHNVFIDQGVNGGIGLFLIYCLIQLYILSCGLRFLRKSGGYNYIFAASFFGWIGFTAQSLISINQIGLAIWGYVLGAVCVGIYKHSEKGSVTTKMSRFNEFSGPLAATGATIGLVFAIPPFYADAMWRSALTSKSLEQVVVAAEKWPQSTDRFIQVSKTLYENKFNSESLEFVRKGLRFNPNNARLWYFLYQMPGSTEEEKKLAKEKLSVLDPFFVVK